jgi:hypothetical protein
VYPVGPSARQLALSIKLLMHVLSSRTYHCFPPPTPPCPALFTHAVLPPYLMHPHNKEWGESSSQGYPYVSWHCQLSNGDNQQHSITNRTTCAPVN